MKKALMLFSIAVTSIAVSGCASIKAPVRPDYTGADNVTEANTSQLVGTWSVTDLNPYPKSDPQITTIEYRQDGTVQGLVIPQGESAAALGNMQFKLTGLWQLDGDTVMHSNMNMETTGDNNSMGSFISKMVNKRQSISGQANIYELSANRIVMMGSDGNAMEYVRQ